MSDRPRTPAQKAASRANGRKSHGPKTDTGKRRSRLNALKHGLRSAKLHPMPNENAAVVRALTSAVQERLSPADDIEHEIADGVAGALLRLRRARNLEHELVGWRPEQAEGRGPSGAVRAFIRDNHGPKVLELLLRYRTQAVNELGRLLRLLAELRRGKRGGPRTFEIADAEALANDNRPSKEASTVPAGD